MNEKEEESLIKQYNEAYEKIKAGSDAIWDKWPHGNPSKTTERLYCTYLYTNLPKNGHFDHLPEIRGQKCVGMSSGNTFRQCDEAMEFIAKIARGDFDALEYRDKALGFLADRGYEHTYETLIGK